MGRTKLKFEVEVEVELRVEVNDKVKVTLQVTDLGYCYTCDTHKSYSSVTPIIPQPSFLSKPSP